MVMRMGRQSHKAIERILKIGSMTHDDAIKFMQAEKKPALHKAAQALGRLARGVPKKFSVEEIERRRKLMEGINERKQKASKARKRRMPNAQGEPLRKGDSDGN